MSAVEMDFTRQSDLVPNEIAKATSVSVIGVGAVGSHVLEVLTKVGITNITMYDYDTVERHNVANQGFGLDEVGLLKTEAVRLRLLRTTGVDVKVVEGKIEESFPFDTDIVISAVDSMAVRKLLWEGVSDLRSTTQLWIDGRMGALYGVVFSIPLEDMRKVGLYSATLHSDAEGIQAPCSAKATIFCPWWMASMMGATVMKHVAGIEQPTYRLDMSFEDNKLLRFC